MKRFNQARVNLLKRSHLLIKNPMRKIAQVFTLLNASLNALGKTLKFRGNHFICTVPSQTNIGFVDGPLENKGVWLQSVQIWQS